MIWVQKRNEQEKNGRLREAMLLKHLGSSWNLSLAALLRPARRRLQRSRAYGGPNRHGAFPQKARPFFSAKALSQELGRQFLPELRERRLQKRRGAKGLSENSK